MSECYTEFERGEREALLQVRSFLIKHGAREVDAFCAQRVHDIMMDARAREGRPQRDWSATNNPTIFGMPIIRSGLPRGVLAIVEGANSTGAALMVDRKISLVQRDASGAWQIVEHEE